MVSVYCARLPLPATRIREACALGFRRFHAAGLAPRPGPVRIRRIKAENWATSWKRHFPSLEIAGKLIVRPSWRRQRPRRGQIEVILDPGLSFGTGHHPTTAYCLAALVRCRLPSAAQSFLDIGTGSGILAIAAAKLGYRPVRALDNDPAAVRIARSNAEANGVGTVVRIARSDIARAGPGRQDRYQVVCANLTAPLLVEQTTTIANRLRPGGRLVLAGILASEFSAVARRFSRTGLRLLSARTSRGWRSATLAKPE